MLKRAKLVRDLADQLCLRLTIEDTWGGDIVTAAVSHLAGSTSPEALFTVSFMNDWTLEHVAGYQPRSERGIGHTPTGPASESTSTSSSSASRSSPRHEPFRRLPQERRDRGRRGHRHELQEPGSRSARRRWLFKSPERVIELHRRSSRRAPTCSSRTFGERAAALSSTRRSRAASTTSTCVPSSSRGGGREPRTRRGVDGADGAPVRAARPAHERLVRRELRRAGGCSQRGRCRPAPAGDVLFYRRGAGRDRGHAAGERPAARGHVQLRPGHAHDDGPLSGRRRRGDRPARRDCDRRQLRPEVARGRQSAWSLRGSFVSLWRRAQRGSEKPEFHGRSEVRRRPGRVEAADHAYSPSRFCTAWSSARMPPEAIYAQGRRDQFGGRSRRNRSTVAYACLQSDVSSATLAP